MKTKSAKAKGRKASSAFVSEILKAFPQLKRDDLSITGSGENGVDVRLSPRAVEVVGMDLALEMKNQERLPLWKALEQAKKNARGDQVPMLVFMRNREDLHVAFELKHFISLVSRETSGRAS